MSWIIMKDGQEVSLAYPRAEDIKAERLAHNISQIVRFNGSACRQYSVAEHSLLVLEIAQTVLGLDVHGQFYALCHDLHEGITGDQTTPSKDVIGRGWHAFEHHFEHMVANELSMVTAKHLHTAAVAVADRMALAIERHQLLPHHQPNGLPSTPWAVLADVQLLTHIDLMSPVRVNRTWQQWRDAWLERFHELNELRNHQSFLHRHEAA